MQFVALIETAYGMEYAHKIASRKRVVALGFGGGDLAADLYSDLCFESMIAYRSRIVQAARYANKIAWDVPYLNYEDPEGLERETLQVKGLGFSAKMAIHPNQVSTISRILSPSASDVQEAKKMLQAYQQAGGHACTYQGKMLDLAIIKRCEYIIEQAKTLLNHR